MLFCQKDKYMEIITALNKQYITEQAKIFKALGHPSRLLMVAALQHGEKCVCDLCQLVGCDISTVSRHLAILKQAHIVTAEKRGTNIYYSLEIPCLENFLSCTAKIIEKQITDQTTMLKNK